MKLLSQSFREIKDSESLRYLGFVIFSLQILVYFLWRDQGVFTSEIQQPVCWSYFPNCQEHFLLSQKQVDLLLNSFLGVSILGILSSLSYRILGFSIFLMWLSWFFLVGFYSFDYSLANNAIVLLIFLILGYLIVPRKIHFTKALIFTSYIFAAALKMNSEWMAGYWLSTHIGDLLPAKGVEWVAALSMVLEITVPFLLFSRIPPRFFTGVGILLVYALFKSISLDLLTGVIDGLLVVFFVFSYYELERKDRESLYQSYLHPEASKLWSFLFLLLFWPLQSLSLISTNISSHKQFPLQFQKYPVPVECQHIAFIQRQTGLERITNPATNIQNSLLKCSPMLNFQLAKAVCEQQANDNSFIGVKSFFVRRLISEKSYNRVFEFENICPEQVSFEDLGDS